MALSTTPLLTSGFILYHKSPIFMTEWKASESAVSLAFELGQPTKLHRGSGLKRPTRLKTQNQVRFAPSAEVCIWDSQTRLVPLSALTCWPAKPWSLVSNWEGQPRHVLKKYRQPCFPPSWHSMVAFHFPKGTSSRGEVPVSQLRIMDEFVNLPHIPDDDGNGHLPGHVPNGQPPPQQPDFTHNMLAQMDPALATLANLQQQGVLVRTWYIHHETHMRNDIPRLVRLGADRHQWIQLIIDAWEGVIDVALPKAFTLPTPMPFRGPVVQFIALGHYCFARAPHSQVFRTRLSPLPKMIWMACRRLSSRLLFRHGSVDTTS